MTDATDTVITCILGQREGGPADVEVSDQG